MLTINQIRQAVRILFSDSSLLEREDFKFVKEILRLMNRDRVDEWILMKRIQPSEKTKKQFNLPDDFKYHLYWNPNQDKIECTCAGFIFNHNCKHSRQLRIFLDELKNEYQRRSNQ